MKSYKRRMTPVERFYVSCDSAKPPFTSPCINQMMLEGRGEFDENAWRRAVELASMHNPGSRLVLRGYLGRAHWKASDEPCRFTVLEDSTWDGMSDVGCPFSARPLSALDGPTTEVVLIKSNPLRLVLRTHHGTMDGRGTQTFLEDIFRALNNEPLLGENSTLTDFDLAKSLHGDFKYGSFYPDNAMPPTGEPQGNEPGSRWIRGRINGAPKQILAKTAINIAKLVNRFDQSKPTRIQLPVDMRPRSTDLRSTGNLTGNIIMEVTPNTHPDEWDRVIRNQLDQMKEAELPRLAANFPLNWLGWLPLSFMKSTQSKVLEKRIDTGRYRTNALISNLGRLPIDQYQGGGFRAHSGLFIPPEFDATAFFLTMAGTPSGIDFVLRTPKVLATYGRLEKALDFILENLEEKQESAAA